MFNKIYIKALMIIITIIIFYTISIVFLISPEVKTNAIALEERNAKAQLQKILLLVQNTALELENYKKHRLESHKQNIKNVTLLALKIAQLKYKKYINGEISEQKAKDEAKKAIGSLRYGNDDYFFITSKDYITIQHPLKRIIGKSMAAFKDKFGNFVVKPMVDDAFSKGEGFNKYWWPRAKGGQVFEKLSYAMAFKPWEWMIGTGVYIDDIVNETQKKKQQLISNLKKIMKDIKIGKTGYLYIFDGNGKMIIDPNRDIESDILKTLRNPVTNNLIYKELMDSYQNNNGTLKYKWDTPKDRKNYIYDKISWINYNKYFDWYIVSSAYIDEINAQSNKIKNYIITTSLILLLIALIISSILFRKLLKPISDLTNNSIKVQDGDFSVRSKVIQNDEIGILANNFNKMLDTIEDHIHNLDDKVDDKTKELEENFKKLQDTQAQLIQSEKMASLGNMVAGVAHEINTPVGMALTGITHVQEELDILENDYNNNKMTESSFKNYINDTKEINKSVHINLTKAADLVKSFKQVAVDQASDENREFNLKHYTEEILSSLHNKIKKTKHVVTLDIDDKLLINSNPGAFSQIITNFIMNSIIHGFKDIEAGQIEIKAKKQDDNLILIYSDNGIGLNKEAKEKIFDPFYTTNRINGGSGLGMNIVFNLVTKKLNGTIKVNDTKSNGVEFILNIPIK